MLNDDQKTKFGLKKLDESEYKSLDGWTTDMLVRALQQTLEPDKLEGAIILSQDEEYLGKITSNTLDSKSLGNELGKYGSEFESKSLFNKFSKYSDSFSNTSVFCDTATKPPLIILKGKVVAYLTINKSISPRANPFAVIGYCKFGR